MKPRNARARTVAQLATRSARRGIAARPARRCLPTGSPMPTGSRRPRYREMLLAHRSRRGGGARRPARGDRSAEESQTGAMAAAIDRHDRGNCGAAGASLCRGRHFRAGSACKDGVELTPHSTGARAWPFDRGRPGGTDARARRRRRGQPRGSAGSGDGRGDRPGRRATIGVAASGRTPM